MSEIQQQANADLEIIEKGIETAWNKQLDFIFENTKIIKNVILVSYDQKFIYLWTTQKLNLESTSSRQNKYSCYKIPHTVKIPPDWQPGWQVGLPQEIEQLLPTTIIQRSKFEFPIISGGLPSNFIMLQKEKKVKNNPYTTLESFLATIIHEFAHAYWNYQ